MINPPTNNAKRIRYFLYARKSSESEDRQVQSIDDQIAHLKEMATRQHFRIVKVYTEAKSAKQPYVRPIFQEMMERIQKGEAEGILCWQINRLSRNPVDSGTINWLLQKGVIKSIQTTERQYLPEDNVLLLSVESGMANQFILDLSKNVKRGISSKLEKGWKPGLAPIGYINKLEDHTIIPDPIRFPLIRRAWDLMLTGSTNPPAVLKKLNDEWGFRSIKRRRSGGFPLANSGMYKIFSSPFYKGIIVQEGREYQGSHQPMITTDEYDRVQMLLGRRSQYRVQKNRYTFAGFIHCGECGCLVTAETKHKTIKSTGKVRQYVYYHCTRKKVNTPCSQRKSVGEVELQQQAKDLLTKYSILPEFRDWALDILRQQNEKEIAIRSAQYESQQQALNSTQQELDNLTRMRYRDMLTDDEYVRERDMLKEKLVKLQEATRSTEARAFTWLEVCEQAFNFAATARQRFIEGGFETRRAILFALGQNPTLKDGKLQIQAESWLQPIADHYPAIEAEYQRLEPMNHSMNITQKQALRPMPPAWHGH